MKKRGFGAGKYNGYGGKVLEGETIEQAALRETEEESKLKLNSLNKVGEIEFHFPEIKAKEWNQKVHVFLISEYEGIPEESEEMTVEWFDLSNLPYSQMWETDTHWLPVILSNKKIKGKIFFEDDCNTTKSFEYLEVSDF